MSGGGGMPDPTAGARPAQARDPLEISREAVAEWLRRVEGARDAMMRSGLAVGREAAELNLACEDLRTSWAKFDEFMNLLLTRIGDDALAKLPLAGMIAMYIQGIGSAGIASKYCTLPTIAHHRMFNGELPKPAQSVWMEMAEARRTIARPLILKALGKGTNGRVKDRVKLLADVNAALAAAADLPEGWRSPIKDRQLGRWITDVKNGHSASMSA